MTMATGISLVGGPEPRTAIRNREGISFTDAPARPRCRAARRNPSGARGERSLFEQHGKRCRWHRISDTYGRSVLRIPHAPGIVGPRASYMIEWEG